MECFRLIFRPSCMNRASDFGCNKRLKKGKEYVRDDEKSGRRDDERSGRSNEVNTPELIGQRVTVRVTMLIFYGSSVRDSVGRGQHSSNRVWGISTWTMHQSTTPSSSHFLKSRWASRQFFTLPIIHTLLPVTFGYSLSSEAVVMRQLRWKMLWRRSLTRSHKRTPMGPFRNCWIGTISALQPGEITPKGTAVPWVYYQ